MIAVQLQPKYDPKSECPKCHNREGIKDGTATLRNKRAYDIMTDSFGLLRCPRCKFRAGWASFHKFAATS